MSVYSASTVSTDSMGTGSTLQDRPMCNQHYESEIEKCIRAGLISANTASGPGLPPLPPLETVSRTSSISSSASSLAEPTRSKKHHLPSDRRPSAEVIGGLQKLAQMVQRATGRDRRAAKKELHEYRKHLSVTAEKVEQDADARFHRIQREWEHLDTQFLSIGKPSRMRIRDELNERSKELTDLMDVRRDYLDWKLDDLDRQWTSIGGRSLDEGGFR